MALITPNNRPIDDRHLAWLPAWDLPLEGPISMLLKFGWANCLKADAICKILFGLRWALSSIYKDPSVSLLATRWTTHNGGGELPSMLQRVANSGLDHYTPGWFHTIASDVALRFCPTCLYHGYQSVLFQIDALATCPIHGDSLINFCRHCGAQTPTYGLTKYAFAKPFHCHVCVHPYSDEFNVQAWNTPELGIRAKTAFQPFVEWLDRLNQSQLEWPGWETWLGFGNNTALLHERRLSMFLVFSRIFSLDIRAVPVHLPPQPVQIFTGKQLHTWGKNRNSPPPEPALSDAAIATRSHIYKSIRRYVTKRLTSYYRANPVDPAVEPGIEAKDEICHLSLSKLQRVQIMDVCVRGLERAPWFSAARRRPLYPRYSVNYEILYWPNYSMVDDAAWAGYILTKLHAGILCMNDYWFRLGSTLPDFDKCFTSRARAKAFMSAYVASAHLCKDMSTFCATYASATMDFNTQDRRFFVLGPTVDLHPLNPWPCDYYAPYGSSTALPWLGIVHNVKRQCREPQTVSSARD